MRRATRLTSLLATGAVLLAGVNACGGTGDSNVVARVGGIAISKSTLDHWTSVELGTPKGADANARAQALSLLISADQLLSEASTMNLKAGKRQAEDRLAELEWARARKFPFEAASKSTNYVNLLSRPGETRADKLLLLQLDLTAARVEQHLFSQAEHELTREQLAAYYSRHKGHYVLPERRDLEVIGSYERPVIMKAKREVEAGADFLAVAKRVSIDQEAPNGLELHLAPGEEEPDYDKVVFSAKPRKLYGPYLQAFFFIFKVLKVTPPRQVSEERSRAAIRQALVQARERQIMDRFNRSVEQIWTPRTDCQAPYVVARCRQYTTTAQVDVQQ